LAIQVVQQDAAGTGKGESLLLLKLYLKGAPELMLDLDKYFVEGKRVTSVMGEQTRLPVL
jgi:hypothetical protein